ncbi:hypothetical protein MLD38_009342 [Melastoma candidum]|uniref:Uncharacterized protein n=1 Tax=Melastoma candidum TaxID=119954 RepID=A0ACB9S098_9MYRT|nr:hypothetical protein MLD38_009342 [Melastoma candidum]
MKLSYGLSPDHCDAVLVSQKACAGVYKSVTTCRRVGRGDHLSLLEAESQRLNIHMNQPNFGKLTSLHFCTWSKGLKTAMYYLLTHAATTVNTSPIKDNDKPADGNDTKLAHRVCSLTNREECVACGS